MPCPAIEPEGSTTAQVASSAEGAAAEGSPAPAEGADVSLSSAAREGGQAAFNLALLLAGRGERAGALECARQAVELGEQDVRVNASHLLSELERWVP